MRGLGPAEGLSHKLLVLRLVWMCMMTWPSWTLATVLWSSPRAPRIPVCSLDWGQHSSHECPLERAEPSVPEDNPYRQQAACTTEEVHTGPPRGKGHSWLYWLKINGTFDLFRGDVGSVW